MTKSFYLLMAVMGLLCTGMFLHYASFGFQEKNASLNAIVSLTGISSPSLSVAYYEPRILIYGEKCNPAYPQMPAIDRMDLVYEK